MSYVNRIQEVLAETANAKKANGLTSWHSTDFYTAAQAFVAHLYTVTLMGEDIGIRTRSDVYNDMMEHLYWDVPDSLKDPMIEAGLDELYSEFMQED